MKAIPGSDKEFENPRDRQKTGISLKGFQGYIKIVKKIITGIAGAALVALGNVPGTNLSAHVDEAITSDYTPSLQALCSLKSAEKAVKTITREALTLNCLSHANQPNFIGTSHGLMIRAPLAKVASIIEDFQNYEDLFEDIDSIKILNQKSDEKKNSTYYRVHTEQNIPLPFIPNVHVISDYFVSRPSPSLQVYRYQLVRDPKHTDVFHSDGVIILEKRGENETAFFEVDFLNANWGIVASIASGRIWPDSIKGFLLSDLAVKNFAEMEIEGSEKKQAARKDARSKASDQLDKKMIETCIASKNPALPYLKSFLD